MFSFDPILFLQQLGWVALCLLGLIIILVLCAVLINIIKAFIKTVTKKNE